MTQYRDRRKQKRAGQRQCDRAERGRIEEPQLMGAPARVERHKPWHANRIRHKNPVAKWIFFLRQGRLKMGHREKMSTNSNGDGVLRKPVSLVSIDKR